MMGVAGLSNFYIFRCCSSSYDPFATEKRGKKQKKKKIKKKKYTKLPDSAKIFTLF